MIRTMVCLSLALLGLTACNYQAPTQTGTDGVSSAEQVQLPDRMPRVDPAAAFDDYSGAYQTFTAEPQPAAGSNKQMCDFLDAGKSSEDWTLGQVGNKIEGFNREVSLLLGSWSWLEERFSGYILQGKLRFNGTMTGSYSRVDNDGLVHYELEYDRRNGWLVGTRNGAPFWAVPCAGLLNKAHVIETLPANGIGRRNTLLERIKAEHPEPGKKPV